MDPWANLGTNKVELTYLQLPKSYNFGLWAYNLPAGHQTGVAASNKTTDI